jgi:hypothetical protein
MRVGAAFPNDLVCLLSGRLRRWLSDLGPGVSPQAQIGIGAVVGAASDWATVDRHVAGGSASRTGCTPAGGRLVLGFGVEWFDSYLKRADPGVGLRPRWVVRESEGVPEAPDAGAQAVPDFRQALGTEEHQHDKK